MKKDSKLIVVHDTETTGIKAEDRILQSAHAVYELTKKGELKFVSYREEFIQPPVPINPMAASIHGIWEEDLLGAKSWCDSESKKELEELISKGAYYVAHNSPFDIEMLSREGLVWPIERVVDTLRVARIHYSQNSEIESKGLQYLRYFFNFNNKEDFRKLVKSFGIEKLQAHTALSDIVVLIYFIKHLQAEGISFEKMLELSSTPIIEDKVTFGNVFEKGSELSIALTSTYEQYGKRKTGLSYFNWAIKNMKMSLDQKFNISYFAIKAAKEGKLNILDGDMSPFIYTASMFIPDFWDYLNSVGFNTSAQRQAGLIALQNTINQKLDSEKEEALNLKKEFDFMERFVASAIQA